MFDDGFVNSHPVILNVETPDLISYAFDSITYSKGASLLYMLESIVGKDNFQKGLQVSI